MFQPETAGHLMSRRVATLPADGMAGEWRHRLHENEWEVVDPVFVTDDGGRFLGAMHLVTLYDAPEDRNIASLMRTGWPRVTPETDQEAIATLARENDVSDVPVVDAEGKLLGCVTALRLLDVIWREHVEDMQRFTGTMKATRTARHALEDSPFSRFARRLPWLLVGLGGSIAATSIMAGFETELSANVEIAFFIPALVYLADAIGTQTEAVAVRGLSLSHKPLWAIFGGELATGLLLGLALGALSFLLIWAGFGDARLGLGVALSLVAAGGAASSVGLVFPWILSRMGVDPAFGSGPVATIVQDMLSLIVYFAVMAAFVVKTM